jgi:hypothetical protein
MKRFLFLFSPMILCAAMASAEDKLGAEKAKIEVERRGPCVQIVDDQIHDLGEEAYFAALSIPADDSHKWFLTVIYDKRTAMTDALKKDFAEAKELEPWVRVKDRGKGTYDVYSTDESFMHCNFEPRVNPFKPEKWKWIKAENCPAIVIQLPISGEWGTAGTVVNQRTGYNGKPDELATWIRDSIKKYTDKYSQTRGYRDARDKIRKLIGFAGHRQVGAWNPPFAVQPKELGHGADPPSPFPPDLVPSTPPEPKVLTLEQIKAIVPDAPADFLMAQLLAKVKTPSEVQVAWLMKQLQDKDKEVKPVPSPDPPVVTPPAPAPDPMDPFAGRPILSWLFTGGGMVAILMIVLQLFGVKIPGLTKKEVVLAPASAKSSVADEIGREVVASIMRQLPIRQVNKPAPSAAASPDSGGQPSAS